MAKYAYPAIFKLEKFGYSVSFPDITCCHSQGDTLAKAKENAKDALCLMLYDNQTILFLSHLLIGHLFRYIVQIAVNIIEKTEHLCYNLHIFI